MNGGNMNELFFKAIGKIASHKLACMALIAILLTTALETNSSPEIRFLAGILLCVVLPPFWASQKQ